MVDLRWGVDLDIGGAETADDLEEYEQDILHVLEQDVGSNPDDLTRGLGLANVLSKIADASYGPKAEKLIGEDDRTQNVQATIVVAADGTVSLDLAIATNDRILNTSIPFGTPIGGR